MSGATVTTAPAATLAANITFSKENASAGEVVTVKANLVNAKQGATYTYSFFAGDKTLADKTTANTTKWTTSTKGEDNVQVVVYENGTPALTSTVKYIVTKRVITIKSIKAKTTKKKGKKILTITTKATATAGKPKYKIVLKKKNGKKVASKGYSAKNQLVWKKAKKGTYKVTVTVQNGTGVVVSKTKTVKVK